MIRKSECFGRDMGFFFFRWSSTLFRRFFFWVLRFSPLLKIKQNKIKFNFCQEYARQGATHTVNSV